MVVGWVHFGMRHSWKTNQYGLTIDTVTVTAFELAKSDGDVVTGNKGFIRYKLVFGSQGSGNGSL